jgi:hypothetical protein
LKPDGILSTGAAIVFFGTTATGSYVELPAEVSFVELLVAEVELVELA